MSSNVKKNSNGLIVNPVDAEDFAYNIAYRLELSYKAQVEIEASLNELATVSNIETRADILETLIETILENEFTYQTLRSQE